MPASISIKPGRTLALGADGKSVFDSDAFPVSYAPEVSELHLAGVTISFPDFRKANAYCWQQWNSGNSAGDPRESAISVITMVNQEWGPSGMVPPPTAGCEIADVVIGTVPALADHCTYRVKLSRTNAPDNVNDYPVPLAFKEGEWVDAWGGSLIVEQIYPFARQLQFYLATTDNGDGTRNVLMRRLMSVARERQSFYRSDNSPTSVGWTYGGTYGSVYGIPVAQRDTRGPTTDTTGIGGRYKRTGSSPAATDDTTDYATVLEGEILILPGYAGIDPISGGATDGPAYFFTDEDSQSAATTYTFTDKSVGDEDTTRRVYVAIVAYTATSSARALSSVTIGGVAASIVVNQTTINTRVTIAAIAAVDLPAGTTATVVATFSGAMAGCSVVVYAGLRTQSLTPVTTLATASYNTAQPIATVAGSFVIAIGASDAEVWGNFLYYQRDPALNSMSGIDNSVVFQTGTSGNDRVGNRAHQIADGETLSITFLQQFSPANLAQAVAVFH